MNETPEAWLPMNQKKTTTGEPYDIELPREQLANIEDENATITAVEY